VLFLVLFGASLQSLAADVITSVQQVRSNPSAFHRHVVVLKGEISVIYLIRCDEQEVNRVSAMAGGRAIVYATIDSVTVTINADGSESRIRAMATKIQREDK
jgi:hypothetical protein